MGQNFRIADQKIWRILISVKFFLGCLKYFKRFHTITENFRQSKRNLKIFENLQKTSKYYLSNLKVI